MFARSSDALVWFDCMPAFLITEVAKNDSTCREIVSVVSRKKMKKCNAESDEEHHAFFEELLKNASQRNSSFYLWQKHLSIGRREKQN